MFLCVSIHNAEYPFVFSIHKAEYPFVQSNLLSGGLHCVVFPLSSAVHSWPALKVFMNTIFWMSGSLFSRFCVTSFQNLSTKSPNLHFMAGLNYLPAFHQHSIDWSITKQGAVVVLCPPQNLPSPASRQPHKFVLLYWGQLVLISISVDNRLVPDTPVHVLKKNTERSVSETQEINN